MRVEGTGRPGRGPSGGVERGMEGQACHLASPHPASLGGGVPAVAHTGEGRVRVNVRQREISSAEVPLGAVSEPGYTKKPFVSHRAPRRARCSAEIYTAPRCGAAAAAMRPGGDGVAVLQGLGGFGRGAARPTCACSPTLRVPG
ncbi:hypothetical protein SKAU_G00306400 [Synaphobranchus kaupii]|uniref:Uncharacterized protein n=1 Tax=Synaphobranchus kaupii TaxID=118154 RepID=A0A9Q1EQT3_SYNKA|nr:hypothetical protein SKAU_G00306400 [Synaphobranchus kaupii]